MARADVRKLGALGARRNGQFTDHLCLRPVGIRIGYLAPKVMRGMPRHWRAAVNSKVVWISTRNAHYVLRGVSPGAPAEPAARTLRVRRRLRIGRHWWYLVPTIGATGLLEVNHGTIERIGIVDRRLTRSVRTARFLTNLS